MANRNYQRYELLQGRKVVYRGITNDLERRATEHSQDKKFTNVRPVGPKVTEQTARNWEKNSLETYQKNHNGNLPRYNKTPEG